MRVQVTWSQDGLRRTKVCEIEDDSPVGQLLAAQVMRVSLADVEGDETMYMALPQHVSYPSSLPPR
jgi:hypothetical protein